MFSLVVSLFCIFLCSPVEPLQLAPYMPAERYRAPFMEATAARGDAALLGFLLKKGAVNRNVSADASLLAAASVRGGALAVRALLALGANPDARYTHSPSNTPLHLAAKSDATLHVNFELLDAGAQVDAIGSGSLTPLMVAVEHGALQTVAELLHAGADRSKLKNYNSPVAELALQTMKPDALAWFLGAAQLPVSQRKNYNCFSWASEENLSSPFLGERFGNSTDSLFRTVLHRPCSSWEEDDAYSGLVNARDLFGRTPLHLAVLRDDEACARRLLRMGADPLAADWRNRTALDIAHYCGFAVSKALVEGGASQQRSEGAFQIRP